MSAKSLVKKSDSIPLSVAVTLVSYSRDYIGRLAREGKIVAEQIDREWYVSRASLLNFAEHSTLEDSVKKKILSLSRKNDLEVKDFYTQKVSNINTRQYLARTQSLVLTLIMLLGGSFPGYLFYTNANLLTGAKPVSIAETLGYLDVVGSTQSALVPASSRENAAVWTEGLVVESQESIPMDGGIVLFPTLQPSDKATVEDLFSDDVTVVITSTTTGFVRSADGTSELPFVRVPETTSF
ncbi:winged helix-turn-helix domain-containing protein [Patescibacteria group bacterium]|nr:winged helix-turn-helix domain-containing protein [Patescibacteria group bacterium]